VIDGAPLTDPTGDLGRTERQRAFLTALFTAVGAERSPLAAQRAAGALAPGLAIDDTMTFLDAIGLMWDLRSGGIESVELPVFPYSTSGGASVVGLVEPDAMAVVDGFG
jgi:anionic cell wall polymer biosynthesis LytR-Cps2A-Psr (LCP) family protein